MDINERFEKFFEYKGIKRSEFERRCGLSNGYTRNLRDSPKSEKMKDILNAFPEINPIWLQTGEGEMILPTINSPVEQRVNGDGNKFSGSGDVSDGVPAALLQQALNEITEMRQLLAESVRNTNDLSQRLMNLLESKSV